MHVVDAAVTSAATVRSMKKQNYQHKNFQVAAYPGCMCGIVKTAASCELLPPGFRAP